jgi:cysteinyl-tRNA synthetase
MPADGWILGVDEHTGCIFDLDARTATVVGNGTVTVRRRGTSAVLASGESVAIESLTVLASKKGPVSGAAPQATPAAGSAQPTVLHAEIRRIEEEFDRALEARDVADAVRAMLELDDTLEAWSGDTTQSDAGERGRAAMRRMVLRLGELATTGAQDPKAVVGGYVEAMLVERAAARDSKRYADSDRIRAALTGLGIELRDTPDGTSWELS